MTEEMKKGTANLAAELEISEAEVQLPDLGEVWRYWDKRYVFRSGSGRKYAVYEGATDEGPMLVNLGPTGIVIMVNHGVVIYESLLGAF